MKKDYSLKEQLFFWAVILITMLIGVLISIEINNRIDLNGAPFLFMLLVILTILYILEYFIYLFIQKRKSKNEENKLARKEREVEFF